MILYLAQHGAALEKAVDPDRPLSPQGISDVTRVATTLCAAGAAPQQILHSGKTRADQTAQILAHHVAAGVTPKVLEGIAPNDPVENFAKQIAAWSSDTLICGHQPFMGRLVSFLLIADSGVEMVEFRPGAIAKLQNEPGYWTLCWFITPELCAQSQC